MICVSSIAFRAASWAAETTKSLTLRPCSPAARLITASASGAIRASMRAVRLVAVGIAKPHLPVLVYGKPPDNGRIIRRQLAHDAMFDAQFFTERSGDRGSS